MLPKRIRLDDDKWDHHGKIYDVIRYFRRPDSTAVELELYCENETTSLTVAENQIVWVEDK